MDFSRDDWYDHLIHGTGPLDPEAVERLEATPALMALLRELVVLPWPEHDDPEKELENDAPFFALLLLGLLRDDGAIDALIALLGHAIEEDWDAVGEIGPAVFGAIGAPALPAVFAELERMEREEMIDAVAIDRDGLDESALYRYWALVIVVEQIAMNHPGTREQIVPFAAARISDTRFDREPVDGPPSDDVLDEDEMPTVPEIWADLQLSLHEPALTPLVEQFFERHGTGFVSSIFGTRELYGEVFADGPPATDARARLLETYRGLHDPDLLDDDDEELDDDDLDDEEDLPPVETYVRPEPKVGRNDPCPCGSGKKYKKCHGA